MKKIIISALLFITSHSFSQQIGDGYAPMINDFGSVLKSGVFGGVNHTGGAPDGSYYGHQHLFVIRHENSNNNHQLQIASSFGENDRLFFRKIAGDLIPKNPNWIELATRGSNTFIGDQVINGNVGIGTNLPTAKLQVNNGNNSYGTILATASETSFSLYAKTLDTQPVNTESFRLGLKYNNDENNGFISFYRGAGSTGGFMGFSTNGLERVRIDGNGNVGIGKVNPNNKLDVNGTIHSKEVKVDMLDWSDFVFKKEYNLPTLAEVEKHINEKGHLENIPSEEEVLKNGINLGEMNAKLLQKIEELTLYVIEIKKENIEMKHENSQIKNKQSELENTITELKTTIKR